jgi:ATP-dependent helicase HrpA
VIITSATIDPERFAGHFGEDVPIVEVSGRTYPVEVRYRRDPEAEDFDQVEAIADAVEELLREPDGDILVFLSGEREIRDTADALTGPLRRPRRPAAVRAPVGGRAAARLQAPRHAPRRAGHERRRDVAHRARHPLRRRPGHGAHQPLQRAAQGAAAADRAGLAGVGRPAQGPLRAHVGGASASACTPRRTSLERPRFTDPEILRTSLAAVILQMAAIGLGDIEAFPFLDPPDRRQVRDGIEPARRSSGARRRQR